MEHIPNYDKWKESPKEPDPVSYCAQCGAPLYEGDVLYTVDGGICEDCLECTYKTIL